MDAPRLPLTVRQHAADRWQMNAVLRLSHDTHAWEQRRRARGLSLGPETRLRVARRGSPWRVSGPDVVDHMLAEANVDLRTRVADEVARIRTAHEVARIHAARIRAAVDEAAAEAEALREMRRLRALERQYAYMHDAYYPGEWAYRECGRCAGDAYDCSCDDC